MATQSYTLAPKESRRWRWRKRIGILFVLLLVTAVIGHAGWSLYTRQSLDQEIAGYRAAGEPIMPEDFVPPPVADEDNAAIVLKEASQSLDIDSATWKEYGEMELSAAPPLSAREIDVYHRIIDENRDALDAVARALKRPGLDWGNRYREVFYLEDMKYLGGQRNVAKLLSAKAFYDHERGDDADAVEQLLNMLAISRDLDHSPGLIGHLVAMGLHAMADSAIVYMAPELNIGAALGGPSRLAGRASGPPLPRKADRARVQLLIQQILDEESYRQGRRLGFLGERMGMLDAAERIADGRISTTGLMAKPLNPQKSGTALMGYLIKPMALGDAKIMVRLATEMMQAAETPNYPAFLAAKPMATKVDLTSPIYLHLVAAILLPSFEKTAIQDYKMLTDRRLAAVVLACRLYAIDHGGDLPATLEGLVPNYLPAVPLDPMAAGQPLRYLARADDPIVYSVGIDGRDDGGYRPPFPATQQQFDTKSDEIRHVKPQSLKMRGADDFYLEPQPLGPPEPSE